MNVDITTDVLILGGGLSGLHTAAGLQVQGRPVVLAEARDRLGGRILSKQTDAFEVESEAGFDLGPAWFWPGQYRMEQLISALGLVPHVVEQFGDGDALFEDPSGAIRRGPFGIAMLGSYRLRGGMEMLIQGLSRQVPGTSIRLGWRAVRLVMPDSGDGDDEITTHFETPDGPRAVRSRHVVMAMPPRLAAELDFEPTLSPELEGRLSGTPTWMAGQGKLVAVYDEPFWRRDGLSGDAVSHRGPLGEIHDISPPAGGDGSVRPGALFGFFAWPPELRRRQGASLQDACLQQLGKLFGKRASGPRQVWLKDWAVSDRTSTDEDRRVMAPHDERGLVLPQEDPWSHRILWSGSESAGVAQRFNGYLEGALEASERALGQLVD